MLNDDDFKRAAAQLKAPVANIKAVCEVEAPGGGFAADGQPRILFEAHKFSKHTRGIFDKSHPNISSPSWNRALYARGANADERNKGEHKRLHEAVLLNRPAALKSASWGKFQILGENYGACGYDDLQEFVTDMYESEAAQLDAFVEFISRDTRLLAALRSSDWKTFARAYNGPAYAENQYDVKLAAAAKKYA